MFQVHLERKKQKKETFQCDEHSFTSSNMLQVVLHNHDVYMHHVWTANFGYYQKHCTLFVSSDSYTLAMEGLNVKDVRRIINAGFVASTYNQGDSLFIIKFSIHSFRTFSAF